MSKKYYFLILALSLMVPWACATTTNSTETSSASFSDGELPAVFSKFSSNVQIYLDGALIVLETDDIPNHPSPYFGQGDEDYEEPHDGMVVNPNVIAEQNYVFQIPADPQVADSASETNLDAIGVSVNGVVLFNQYAGRTITGDWLPLDNEIATFDIYNGHPAGQDNYHYHLEPVYLTEDNATALVGFILDGFPIYGPQDMDGIEPSDLDECNGHTAATLDYPDGIYHYHTTDEEPYLVGCYRGTPGTVTN